MKPISLLILAAGRGSRYKGQKQIDAVGKNGESLMEFALYDALQLGIQNFVFIINNQFPKDFKNRLTENLNRSGATVHFVEQTLYKYIPEKYHEKLKGREKPLGTAHAVYCAKEYISDTFITLNADDFYGFQTYKIAVEAICNGVVNPNTYAMLGFILKNTLSENGTVSRGICSVQNDELISVEEYIKIEKTEDAVFGLNEKLIRKELSLDALTSMNLWVLHHSFFNRAQAFITAFLENEKDLSTKEIYLPGVISQNIQNKEIDVKVLPTPEKWFGLTYRKDKEKAVNAIEILQSGNKYPDSLWES